jgi:hypothetical protein
VGIARLVLDYISALIWPALVAGLAVAFRRPIHAFLTEITEVTFPGGSAKRGDLRAHQLRVQADRSLNMPTKSIPTTTGAVPSAEDIEQSQRRLTGLAGTDPYMAVIEASGLALNSTARKFEAPVDWTTGPAAVMTEKGAPAELTATAQDLWQFRTDMVHGTVKVSEKGARDYVAATFDYLRSLAEL